MIRGTNEISYVIIGIKRLGFLCAKTEGTPVSVVPNIEFAMRHLKYVLGTYHTHPGFSPNPSTIDMDSWKEESKMYKLPVWFIIDSQKGMSVRKCIDDDCYEYRNAIKLWRFIWLY